MKTTNLIRAAICLALLILQFAFPSSAKACLCGEPLPAQEFLFADAVFAGKVVAVSKEYLVDSPLDRLLSRLRGQPILVSGYMTTFWVLKSWKSVGTTSVTVSTNLLGDCGFDSFNLGDDYLVYAKQWNGSVGLDVNRCSRTTRLSHAIEDLTYLNTLPVLPLTPVTPIPDHSWLFFAGTILLLAVLLLLARGLIRRRRQSQSTGEQS